jgi:hypothetical protein
LKTQSAAITALILGSDGSSNTAQLPARGSSSAIETPSAETGVEDVDIDISDFDVTYLSLCSSGIDVRIEYSTTGDDEQP